MRLKRQGNLPVSSLRNLGPKSAMILAEAGIRTIGELRALGAVKAYARSKALHPKSVSLNLLWGLAAGLGDRDWRELSSSEKVRLKGEAAKAMRFPWGVGLRLRPPSAMLINVRDGIWLRAAT